jgi:uncharacterized protein
MDPIENFAYLTLKDDPSGHSYQHADRVRKLALEIQTKEGGNRRLIESAALLHDCVDAKLFKDTAKQYQAVEALLKEQGFTPDESAQILTILRTISWHGEGQEKPMATLEGKIVRDADRLEALGAIGIIRTIEYGASRGRPFYEESNLKTDAQGTAFASPSATTLSHFYEKLLLLDDYFLTPTAKAMARKRSRFMRRFLKEFYRELDE